MNFDEKIEELYNLISKTLLPRITGPYVLWDLPYYTNIGDTLIWEGTLHLLKRTRQKCLDYASKEICTFPQLPSNAIILLQGGGNFGDLWREHQEFRLQVISQYPDNCIIMLPQSVHYNNEILLQQDAERMSFHRNLTLCTRDRKSYELLSKSFNNEILLLPDMAFCIPYRELDRYRVKEMGQILYLKREDKELNISEPSDAILMKQADVKDWPGMSKPIMISRVLIRLVAERKYFYWCPWGIYGINLIAKYIHRPILFRLGIRFLSRYQTIYTTRLHTMILAILLRKKVSFLDNSYGKNSAFFDTWLKDVNDVAKI